MRPFGFLAALIAAAPGLTACRTFTEPAQVGSVSVAPSVATVSMGGTLRLTVTVRDIGGGILSSPSVTFQSSAPLTATVDNAGVVSALAVGPATITATSGGRAGTVVLQVSPPAAVALGVGTSFTCALSETGAAYCWGANDTGQLGSGTTAPSTTPVAVAGDRVFSAITSGAVSTCGITASDGQAYCWGNNDFGGLGNGSLVSSNAPVPVSGQHRFTSLSAGGGFACGLTVEREAWCWGNNYHGQLGTTDPSFTQVPVAVAAGGLTFRSLSAGIAHVCGMTVTGTAECWGWNTFSQLGDGTSVSRSTPAPVGGGLSFTSLAPGASTTCGIAGGDAYCWGYDFFGSLGQGSTTPRPDVKLPVKVVGGIAFTEIRAAPGNVVFTPGCGITASGAAYCWGANTRGQLGTSLTPDTCSAFTLTFGCSGTPLAVSGGIAFQVVVPASEHTCGITRTHVVMCWGANSSGQLGDGTTTDRVAPVGVAGGLRAP